MAVVDIPAMPDGFDDEAVVVSVPGDDGTIVARTELVVRIAGQLLESMGGPVLRLVEFLDQSLLGFAVEAVEQIECFRYPVDLIDIHPPLKRRDSSAGDGYTDPTEARFPSPVLRFVRSSLEFVRCSGAGVVGRHS